MPKLKTNSGAKKVRLPEQERLKESMRIKVTF